MKQFWTISRCEISGISKFEMTAEEWLASGLKFCPASLAAGTLSFRVMMNDITTPDVMARTWHYDQRVCLWLRPESATDAGKPDYSAGEKWFEGLVKKVKTSSKGGSVDMSIVCEDYWTTFNKTYLQKWSSGGAESVDSQSTNVFLFCGLMMEPVSAGQQIEDAINSVADLWTPRIYTVRPGVEPQGFFLPTHHTRDVAVKEVIQTALERVVDVFSFWNYSGTIPELVFRRYSQASARMLAFSDLMDVDLMPRADTKLDAVQINFEVVNVIDDVARQLPLDVALGTVQVSPASAWDASKKRLKDEILQGNVLVQTIQLSGASVSLKKASVFTEPVDVNDLEWWKKRLPGLALTEDSPIAAIHVLNAPALRDATTGEDLDQDYWAYELVEGSIEGWMGDKLGYFTRRAKCWLQVELIHKNGTALKETKHFTLRVTNCPPGDYQALDKEEFAEEIPQGVADYIYTAARRGLYEGTITIVGNEVTKINQGELINISGGFPDWVAMFSVVQGVTYDIDRGVTTISVGIPRHLSASDLIDMRRISRNRNPNYSASARVDSTKFSGGMGGGGGGEVEIDAKTPNNMESDGQSEYDSMRIGDATNYVHATGASGRVQHTTDGALRVDVNPADLAPGDLARFRPISVCVNVGTPESPVWAQKTMKVMGSQPV